MPANTPSQLFPIEIRRKTYPPRFINLKHGRGNKERYSDKTHFDEGGQGFETMREIRVCPECFRKLSLDRAAVDIILR